MIFARQILAVCLLGGLASTAYAQATLPPPPGAPAAPQGQAPSQASDAAMQKAVDQRIATLQAKLAITQAQTAEWNDFAKAMSENAASTNKLFAERAQNAASMTAVENMKSYADIARAYADNTQRLSTAFATLYAKLAPDQQKTADELFRAPPATSSHSRH
jgi:protein CpxP